VKHNKQKEEDGVVLISQATPGELPPSSEPDCDSLIRTVSQLLHLSFPGSAECGRSLSPRFNIYPALLHSYREFLPDI